MTPPDRARIEHEVAARIRYGEMVRLHGPAHFVTALRPGFGATTWTGSPSPLSFTRRTAACAHVRGLAERCATRVSELRARLTAADYDDDRAEVTDEERLADATAERAVVRADERRWRKSA